jgi:DNA-binding transcriptional ArsR family regulator
MQAKPEYRDRGETEVAVLDALVERPSEGMTVFELRSHVDASIDDLEDALGSLKADGLIDAEENGGRTVFLVDERVIPDGNEQADEPSWLDAIRRRIGL